jgi:hypothetical protein
MKDDLHAGKLDLRRMNFGTGFELIKVTLASKMNQFRTMSFVRSLGMFLL